MPVNMDSMSAQSSAFQARTFLREGVLSSTFSFSWRLLEEGGIDAVRASSDCPALKPRSARPPGSGWAGRLSINMAFPVAYLVCGTIEQGPKLAGFYDCFRKCLFPHCNMSQSKTKTLTGNNDSISFAGICLKCRNWGGWLRKDLTNKILF